MNLVGAELLMPNGRELIKNKRELRLQGEVARRKQRRHDMPAVASSTSVSHIAMLNTQLEVVLNLKVVLQFPS